MALRAGEVVAWRGIATVWAQVVQVTLDGWLVVAAVGSDRAGHAAGAAGDPWRAVAGVRRRRRRTRRRSPGRYRCRCP